MDMDVTVNGLDPAPTTDRLRPVDLFAPLALDLPEEPLAA